MSSNILSVAQVNAYIKKLFEMDYIVKNVWIQGEVSNCKLHSSGHVYFTLKDATSAISCVLFKGYRQNGSEIALRDGMKVIAQGSISVYERSGQYQLYVKEVIQDGIGLLYKKFEELKAKLNQLGYFDAEHKKPLPFYPRKIGVVTSETGAALQDIINIAKRRNPYIQLVLYPTLVQGDEAKKGIVAGIAYLDKMEEVDVIIVGRGGGSLEDLWPFNEEMVAKAIYEASTPIVSAVGHETDFTISDFVSDLRAPTPSAAAELAIPSIFEINETLKHYQDQLLRQLFLKFEQKKALLELYKARFEKYHPKRSIEQMMQYLTDLQARMDDSVTNDIKDMKTKVALLSQRLSSASPITKLSSGYAYVTKEDFKVVKTIKEVKVADGIIVQLLDGQVLAKVTFIKE
ncbi:MAG: exodeoxyribonuclease VII large subunit, partial [Vallitaleaceae bacterium]|nr:exodeoxyribonuclease VII large subunit [Vallitaleaceae bacterium]